LRKSRAGVFLPGEAKRGLKVSEEWRCWSKVTQKNQHCLIFLGFRVILLGLAQFLGYSAQDFSLTALRA
jgi:hypothetical protein